MRTISKPTLFKSNPLSLAIGIATIRFLVKVVFYIPRFIVSGICGSSRLQLRPSPRLYSRAHHTTDEEDLRSWKYSRSRICCRTFTTALFSIVLTLLIYCGTKQWVELLRYNAGSRAPVPAQDLVTGMKDCPPLKANNSRIIWAFWDKGWNAMPDFHQYNVLHWTKLHNMQEWELRVLSLSDQASNCHITNWDLDLPPQFYKIKGDIMLPGPVVQADLVRSALISGYGGFWMDTSIVLQEPIENFCGELFLPHDNPNAKSICGFDNGYQLDHWTTLPAAKTMQMFENWAFGARADDPFMASWHNTFKTFWTDRLSSWSILWYYPYLELPWQVRHVYLTQHTAFQKTLRLDPGMLEHIEVQGKINRGPSALWDLCSRRWYWATLRIVRESPPKSDLLAAIQFVPLLKLPKKMRRKVETYGDTQLVNGSLMDLVRKNKRKSTEEIPSKYF